MLTALIGQRFHQRTARIKTGLGSEFKRNIVVADIARRVKYYLDASAELSRVLFLEKAAKTVERRKQAPDRDAQIMDSARADGLPTEP